MMVRRLAGLFTAVLLLAAPGPAQRPLESGAFGDPAFFPIAVWLQSPRHAARYRAAGINTYVGLWEGPTEAQLAELKAAGMKVVCDQNAVGLAKKNDATIIAWMHGDEPDNAQALPSGAGWGPPIPPATIVKDYERIRSADPKRPVLLNLGQGVAWDGWYGRGVRSRKPEDYPEYVQGADIVSFDIYPAVHEKAEVKGKLEIVPFGVERLRKWAGPTRRVWNCIETTRISNLERKPTPHEVRAEVWMSLIHGSRGIVYFAHQFKPTFIEAGLLAEAEVLAEVTSINRTITDLATVLNQPNADDVVEVRSAEKDVPVAFMAKKKDGCLYLFAVSMRPKATTAEFRVQGLPAQAKAEMIGAATTIAVANGHFEDRFGPYDVRLYRIR